MTTFARDGRGRLWLAGGGLWLGKPDRSLLDLEPVPSVGRGSIATIVPDPKHEDGVIVAAGDRGVMFLQVEATR